MRGGCYAILRQMTGFPSLDYYDFHHQIGSRAIPTHDTPS